MALLNLKLVGITPQVAIDLLDAKLSTVEAATAGAVSDTAYNATTWNSVTDIAPSKNAVRDQIETMLTSIAAKLPLAGGTMSGAIAMGTSKITGMGEPTLSQDAATKNYVDTVASALNPLQAAQAASTANIAGTYNNGVAGVGATFTVTATGAFTIDGQTPAVNSRILLKDQSTGFQNGVYNLTLAGSLGVSPILTRALDYNTAVSIDAGDLIPVITGTVNATTSWLQTANVVTVGTDALVFAQWTANPSAYMQKANNLSDLTNAGTSRTNLGLGTLATQSGTFSGTSSGTNTGDQTNITGNSATTSVITNWATYTPTFTGFGTVTSIDFWWRRVGDSVEIRGKAVSGTTTATEGRISLPNSYSSDATKVPAIGIFGQFYSDVQALDPSDQVVLCESNVAYLTFGYRNAGAKVNDKRLGSDMQPSAKAFNILCTIPISGLSA